MTLGKAVEIARKSEMVKSKIKGQSVSTTNVEAVRKHNTYQVQQNISNNRGRGHENGEVMIIWYRVGGNCSQYNLRETRNRRLAKGKQCCL